MSSGLNVRFDPPEHGWMIIEVTGGEQRREEDVSDVFADSLKMLVEGIASILDGADQREIPWFLEPDVVKWHFLRTGEEMEFRVIHERTSQVVFTFRATANAICLAIWRGLRRLETSWPEGDTPWSHPFPERAMQELTQKLKASEGAE